MNRWHFMALGLIAWLAFGALGLKWTARPYFWMDGSVVTLGGCDTKNLEMAQQEFPLHVAAFPPAFAAPAPAPTEEAAETFADEPTRDWAWREMRNRFVMVFVLWMAAGWFIHWCLGRLAQNRDA